MPDEPECLLFCVDIKNKATATWASAFRHCNFQDSQRTYNTALSNFRSQMGRIRREAGEAMEEGTRVRICGAWEEGGTFRHELLSGYKAHRRARGTFELAYLHAAARLLEDPEVGGEVYWSPGYEADDVLAAMATRSRDAGWEVRILTSDSDLCQVVGDGITVWSPKGGGKKGYDRLDPRGVVERYSFPPEAIAFSKAIIGDKSDGIPGVHGLGHDAVKRYIADGYKDVRSLFENIERIGRGEREKLLRTGEETVLLYERLATLVTDIPVASYKPRKLTVPPPHARPKPQAAWAGGGAD